jgi:hypothetical protein
MTGLFYVMKFKISIEIEVKSQGYLLTSPDTYWLHLFQLSEARMSMQEHAEIVFYAKISLLILYISDSWMCSVIVFIHQCVV